MSDIFLSYKSEDKPRAKIIAEALKQQGYSVWWDEEIPPGKAYDKFIEEALDAAKCVVVLWSIESIKLNEGEWVRTEASEGKRRGILVPILIDDVVPPLAFRLIQAAKLIDWNGTLPNPKFDLLLKSISEHVDQPAEQNKDSNDKIDKLLKKGGTMLQIQHECGAILIRYQGKNLCPVCDFHEEMDEGEKTRNKRDEENIINSIGMKFTHIPAGEFKMGSQPDEDGRWNSEGPIHNVKILNAFYMAIYPVTQKEWQRVMGRNPSFFKGDGLPVEQVSWHDVQEFIKKLNENEGINKYRLPSEAEWEYATRAGTTTRFFCGDNDSNLHAWYNKNSGGKTHPVGEYKSNPWDLYDMHGNIWEWVQDKWHNNYNGSPADGSAWENGDSSNRSARGGSWLDNAKDCRSASRHYHDADDRQNDLGFRLVRDL